MGLPGNYTGASASARTNSAARSITTTTIATEESQLRQADYDVKPHACLQEQRIYELPVGRTKQFLSNANRVWMAYSGWKLSGILTMTSGTPFTVSSPLSTFTKVSTGNTPDVSGKLGKDLGSLPSMAAARATFAAITQGVDPSTRLLTPALAAQSTSASRSRALDGPVHHTHCRARSATWHRRSSQAPVPSAWIWRTKQFAINERFNFELRTDWLNAANHPDFSGSSIDSNINSATSVALRASGASGRIIVVSGP
jgi:hypothetical protein